MGIIVMNIRSIGINAVKKLVPQEIFLTSRFVVLQYISFLFGTFFSSSHAAHVYKSHHKSFTGGIIRKQCCRVSDTKSTFPTAKQRCVLICSLSSQDRYGLFTVIDCVCDCDIANKWVSLMYAGHLCDLSVLFMWIPTFGNNFGEIVRHRKDVTKMTSHTWRQVFADSIILWITLYSLLFWTMEYTKKKVANANVISDWTVL